MLSDEVGSNFRSLAWLVVDPAQLSQLLAKFRHAGVQRQNARVVIGVDLPESLELRLCGDHLPCKIGSRIQHRFSFLLDVERIVFTRKLSKLVRGIVQILLRNLKTFFEKYPLPVRGRSRQFRNQRIQFVNISIGKSSGSLRASVGNADGNDSTLFVF